VEPVVDTETVGTYEAGAIFNEDRTRRYALWRAGYLCPENTGKTVLFIMLNPSIADERRLDPTVRRCYNYARRWGYGRVLIGNLYSKVSTNPRGLDSLDFKTYELRNADSLIQMANSSQTIVAAWGTNADHTVAADYCWTLCRDIECLGRNKDGSPKHPLYLRNDQKLEDYWIVSKLEYMNG
jgi:hypothetical protein